MKNKFHFAAILAFAITPLLAAEKLAPIDLSKYDAPVKVACVGDSITYGSGAEKGMSYPSQLQELLGEKWKVKNYGLGGRTLMDSGNAPYMNEKAYKNALNGQPDVVVIMLGTNDTKPKNWDKKEGFVADYTKLVKSFQALESKPQIWVCRPCPVPGKGNFGINEAGVQEQIPLVDKLAEDLGLGVIDMHAALVKTPELLPDRVHPNTEGAGKMAEAAFTALTGKPAPVAVGAE